MTVTRPLPVHVEDLTPDWLSEALGARVATMEVLEVIWGSATKVRIRAELQSGEIRELCVKGALGDRFAGVAIADSAYVAEAAFYRDVAPHLRAGIPDAAFAATDERGQGIVIMPDLSVAGGRFGDPLSPYDVDSVAQALELQAQWHAACWGGRLPHGEVRRTSVVRMVGDLLLVPDVWNAHFALETSRSLPEPIDDPVRVLDAFHRLWSVEDSTTPTLVHGDAHIGNTYADGSGRVTFLDWQGVCFGAWSLDVAYFLVGALTIADRRAAERELVAHYRDALVAGSGATLDPDTAWAAYRNHCLHGLLWAVTPAWMQPPERCAAMTERYVAAIEDHDPVGILSGVSANR